MTSKNIDSRTAPRPDTRAPAPATGGDEPGSATAYTSIGVPVETRDKLRRIAELRHWTVPTTVRVLANEYFEQHANEFEDKD